MISLKFNLHFPYGPSTFISTAHEQQYWSSCHQGVSQVISTQTSAYLKFLLRVVCSSREKQFVDKHMASCNHTHTSSKLLRDKIVGVYQGQNGYAECTTRRLHYVDTTHLHTAPLFLLTSINSLLNWLINKKRWADLPYTTGCTKNFPISCLTLFAAHSMHTTHAPHDLSLKMTTF